MFEFTLFLPRMFFSVFRLEPSKKLSLKLSGLAQLGDASDSLYDFGTAHIQAARVDLPVNTHGVSNV